MENITAPELQNTIAALAAKNVSYELTGANTQICWCGNEPVETGNVAWNMTLGVKVALHKWAWYTIDLTDNMQSRGYWFQQLYNMNTGKVLKSIRTEWKVRDLVEKLIGLTLTY